MGSLSKRKESLIYPLEYYNDLDAWVKQVSVCVRQIGKGKLENTGTFTLEANTQGTTVVVPKGNIGTDSVVLWTPTTAHAADAIGSGSIYLVSIDASDSSFLLKHVNNTQTDRTFKYVIIG